MSKKISTYNDLLEEKARLEELLAVQRQTINANYVGLKHELSPIATGLFAVTGFFGKLGRKRSGNPLVNLGLDIGTELLLKRYLLIKAGWLARTVVPYIVRNYSTKFFNGKAGPLWTKLKNMFSRKAAGS